MEIEIIAHIRTDFREKFGIPRQSGLVETAKGRIVFEPKYRSKEALRGMEEFSHLWLLWECSENKRENWSATVRPPRLGGKERVGVFATRSSFRPNPIAMSVVKLEGIVEDEQDGMVIEVSGVDMLDGTPIYDIKPYLPYADSYPYASAGFGGEVFDHRLQVDFPEELLCQLPEDLRPLIIELIAEDPRTAFIKDEERIWGMTYADYNVRFRVRSVEGNPFRVATVVEVTQLSDAQSGQPNEQPEELF